MDDALVIQILLGVLAAAVGVTGYLLAARTGRVQAESSGKAVDAEAYARARAIYEGAIGTLEQRIKSQGDQIALQQDELNRLRATNKALETEAAELRAELATWRGNERRGSG
jgi:archaellum component FlaC